jgi:hypothetical protein
MRTAPKLWASDSQNPEKNLSAILTHPDIGIFYSSSKTLIQCVCAIASQQFIITVNMKSTKVVPTRYPILLHVKCNFQHTVKNLILVFHIQKTIHERR